MKKLVNVFKFILRLLIRYISKGKRQIKSYFKSDNPLGQVPFYFFSFNRLKYSIKSYSQQGEDLTLDRILHRKLGLDLLNYKGLYVDAGAYHPISHSTTYLLYLRGWKGICIDISKESCRLIKKLRPKDIVVNAATSNENDTLFFKDNGISLINSTSKNENSNAQKIKAFTLNTILSDNNINQEIDYLNIDTEGAELETLKGLDFNTYKPKVISVEIHSDNILSALESEVSLFLFKKGYKCVACNVITYFFIKNEF